MYLEGIDTSGYQGHVNWNQIKLDDISFAATKATEGDQFKDESFPLDWQGMAAHTIHRFAYHFFYDFIDPIAQCNFHHEYVRDNGHYRYGDALLLDVEEYGTKEPATTVERMEQFVKHAWQTINKPVSIYTNYDTWVNILGNPVSGILSHCPLWQASYSAFPSPLKNWPRGISFWQYSCTGYRPGIDGQVDLDRFLGDQRQLHRIMTVVPKH